MMTEDVHHDDQKVLVVDFGAQYAQLIARRIRECRVYSEIVPHSLTAEEIRALKPSALVLSGGPMSVYEEGAPSCDPGIFELGVPILGICYGMQLMAHALGGEVERTGRREYGRTSLAVARKDSRLFSDLPLEQTVWMSHSDAVKSTPSGFAVSARTESSPVAAMECPERGLFGVQFHPEVAHTERGTEIIKNFLFEAAGCQPTWTMFSIIEDAVARVRESVGNKKVICGLSGGVDSSVAAALVHRAVGDNLTCIFVDHGLLRGTFA